MIYRLFGWWYRWQACKLAAQALANHETGKVFSLAVFFETYMLEGANGTEKDFGPADPVELKVVSDE